MYFTICHLASRICLQFFTIYNFGWLIWSGLVGWLVGWLPGWLTDWLTGWLTSCCLGNSLDYCLTFLAIDKVTLTIVALQKCLCGTGYCIINVLNCRWQFHWICPLHLWYSLLLVRLQQLWFDFLRFLLWLVIIIIFIVVVIIVYLHHLLANPAWYP